MFFRACTAEEAQKLGVVGWVSNTSRNTVEGEAQGQREKLEAFKVSLVTLGTCKEVHEMEHAHTASATFSSGMLSYSTVHLSLTGVSARCTLPCLSFSQCSVSTALAAPVRAYSG